MKILLREIKRCSAFFLGLGVALVFASFPAKSSAGDTNQTVEVIPPAPTHYFNDYAGVVSPATATRLNSMLENNERQTSDQIVVALFPKMQSAATVRDYTLRIANAWKVGQKGKNNGVVLFLFTQDHKMYVQVGTGLEKVLPDATSKMILETKIIPFLKKGDYDGAMTAGVTAFIEATKGAYQGNGKTAADEKNVNPNAAPAGTSSPP